MEETHVELNRRFGIAGVAEVVEGQGGWPKVRVTTRHGTGDMYLHGAHVTSWTPASAQARDVLFVSRQSRWEEGRAIRGGVPICFPWFGPHVDQPAAPAHGFVRTKAWALASIVEEGDDVVVSMVTGSDAGTKRWWPADFRLLHRVTFGASLTLELVVTNLGETALRFEEALHAYYRIEGLDEVRLSGLDGNRYRNKADANREKIQHGDIAIGAETDRVYLETRGAVEIADVASGRRVHIAAAHADATVVWNPWTEKACALPDLADDEWREFVCVESCNVAECAIDLAPGHAHTMRAVVSVTTTAPASRFGTT